MMVQKKPPLSCVKKVMEGHSGVRLSIRCTCPLREPKKEEKKEESRERPRLRKFAKKIFGESEAVAEGRDILGAVWETGDKAKTEVVRLVAREVRGYLEALELHKDIRTLLTDYSLEVKASFHLKPLQEENEVSVPETTQSKSIEPHQEESSLDETEPPTTAKPVQLGPDDSVSDTNEG